MSSSKSLTISQAIAESLELLSESRSARTCLAYRNGLKRFADVLEHNNIHPDRTPAEDLPEEAVLWMLKDLKTMAPASERLYLTAVVYLYETLEAGGTAKFNLIRLRQWINKRARRPGVRLPEFPNEAIERLLEQISTLVSSPTDNEIEHLRNLRDRAFLTTLADTGLRVHEACGLRRSDLDWNEYRAVVIGKGDRQAVVRFSQRSIRALRDYLGARAKMDGASGRPLSTLPLFIRHDKGAGRNIHPMTTTTGRDIVRERVRQFLGDEAVGSITPHSFRHYFVTRVLKSSGNLKLAQELARHRSITVTQRYAHLSDNELDKGFYDAIEGEKE